MEELALVIQVKSVDRKLPCASAFRIASTQRVMPIVVGQETSKLGIRINRCQLGLFGYDEQGKKRIVKPAASVSKSLEEAIQARLVEGRLPCRAAWEVAEEHDLSKLEVANAAEGLKLHISNCQLGCFT